MASLHCFNHYIRFQSCKNRQMIGKIDMKMRPTERVKEIDKRGKGMMDR